MHLQYSVRKISGLYTLQHQNIISYPAYPKPRSSLIIILNKRTIRWIVADADGFIIVTMDNTEIRAGYIGK